MSRNKTELDTDDIDAAFAAAFGDPEIAAAASPKGRKARERRQAMKPNDGRKKRSVSPDQCAQLNVAIRRELRERLVLASKAQRIMIVDVVEKALEAYLPKLEKGGRHA